MSHEYSQRLKDTDLVGMLQPSVDNREFSYNFMGDEWIQFPTSPHGTTTPWLFAKSIAGHHCTIYHTVYHEVFGVIPQCCFNHCWKLTANSKGKVDGVYRQLTFREVMRIEKLQQWMGTASKCGMDIRDYTPYIWGAYWYFSSKEEAQRSYNKIKGYLGLIDHEIEVLIKRSCTEYELDLGPSSEWDNLDIVWKEKESVLDEWVYRVEQQPPPQHKLIKKNVRNRMMHWAHKHGDMTYKEFNRGNDLLHTVRKNVDQPMCPAVTYNP